MKCVIVLMLLLMFLVVMFVGCNIVVGVGKDVQKVGEMVEDVVKGN